MKIEAKHLVLGEKIAKIMDAKYIVSIINEKILE